MYHLGAFDFTAANTGAGVFSNMSAIADGWLTRNSATRYFIPSMPANGSGMWTLLAAYAQGPTMTVARVVNAELQKQGFPSIIPVVTGATVPSLYPLRLFGSRGPKIPVADEFGIQADSTAAELQRAAVWLHDGVFNIPAGPIFPLQFTAAITTVAETWTAGNLTLTQLLPPGRYAVVGMDVVAATNHFARLVFSSGGPRPGVLTRAATTVFPPNVFSGGNFGTLGEFDSYSVPQLEVINSASGAITFQGVLELIRIGGPRQLLL